MPPAPLQSHLGYWLRFLSNHVSHAFRLKVESHGVTVAEWVLLRSLFGAEPASPSQIADALGMTRGAISKLVDRLAAKRLVLRRHPGKSDRRFQSLSLSPAGRKLVPTLASLADQNDREFFAHLTPRERQTLFSLLQRTVHTHGLKTTPVD